MPDAAAPAWMPALPLPFEAEAGGLRWRVHAWGGFDALPLVLLHGFGADGRAWAPLAERLASAWRVLAVDLPGHGGTTAPTPPQSWDLSRAAQALAALLPALDSRVPTLVGYSLGGRLALHVALQSRLAGLVLVGASAGLRASEARADRLAADAAWIARLGEGLPAFWEAWDEQPVFATRRALSRFERAFPDHVRGSQDPVALAAAMAAFGLGRMAPLHERLGSITCPAIVVAGEHDAKFRALGEELVTGLRHATFSQAPGAGHDVPLESPDAIVRALAVLRAGAPTPAIPDTKGQPR